MPTKIKRKKPPIDKDLRHKRHRTRKTVIYQNWQVWNIGADRHLLLSHQAKLLTFKYWRATYNEPMTTQSLNFLCVIRLYCAHNGVSFFKRAPCVIWGIKMGYLSTGYKYSFAYKGVFSLLEDLHFCNPLSNHKYSLTNRAKLLFSYYEQHLKKLLELKA